MARDRSEDPFGELVHPVYLDVPMMVSFLASIDDGVSFRSDIAERTGSARKDAKEADGGVGLPSLASLLGLSLSVSGRYSRNHTEDETAEHRFTREHTSASLFNIFRRRLITSGSPTLFTFRDSSGDVPEPGSLVEVSGEVLGNPLRQTLDLFVAIAPFFGLNLEDEQGGDNLPLKKASRSGNPATRAAATSPLVADSDMTAAVAFMKPLIRDAARSPVVDLLMSTTSNMRAILTVSREYLSLESEAYLLEGDFRVLGKVTSILGANDRINLLRRTALGFGGVKLAETLFNGFSSDELDIKLASPTVPGPAMQILPLAIYI